MGDGGRLRLSPEPGSRQLAFPEDAGVARRKGERDAGTEQVGVDARDGDAEERRRLEGRPDVEESGPCLVRAILVEVAVGLYSNAVEVLDVESLA